MAEPELAAIALGEKADHPGVPGVRRRTLVVPGEGRVRAEIEDDFHHFTVEILHDGERILDVVADAIRFPWSTCDMAALFLADRLKGTPLADAASFDDQFSHCTHLFDLALLAATHALDAGPSLFSMFVSDAVDNRQRAELRRNGELVLAWDLEGSIIVAPTAPAGESLRRLREWLPTLTAELREPAKLLRRAVFISSARPLSFDGIANAAAVRGQVGACFTFQPERAVNSHRTANSRRDFTGGEGPLAHRRDARAAEAGSRIFRQE